MTQPQQEKNRLWVRITLLMCQSHLFLSFHYTESQYYCFWKESDDKESHLPTTDGNDESKEQANHHHPKANPPTPGPWGSCDSHGTLLWLRTQAAADAHPPGSHSQPANCCCLNIILLTMWIFSRKDNYLFHLWMNQSGTCSKAALEECKKLR